MMMPRRIVYTRTRPTTLPNVERNDTNVLQVITEVPFDADPGGGNQKEEKKKKRRDGQSSIQQKNCKESIISDLTVAVRE